MRYELKRTVHAGGKGGLTSLATSLSLLPILSKMEVRLSCSVTFAANASSRLLGALLIKTASSGKKKR